MAILRDGALAEDVVQDTFVVAFTKHDQLRDEPQSTGGSPRICAVRRSPCANRMRHLEPTRKRVFQMVGRSPYDTRRGRDKAQ